MERFWPSTKPASRRPWRNATTRWSESSGDRPLIHPIIGFGCCCARAVSGQPTAAPPSSVMKSRRFN
jgi:hypothetical protein